MADERCAFYMHSMFGGGAERVFALIASALARRGRRIDLVLNRAEGPNLAFVDPAVRIIDLKASTAAATLKLTRYLRRERPSVILAGLNNNNAIALLAARLAGVPMIATVHHLDQHHARDRQTLSFAGSIFNAAGPLIYRHADGVGCVSKIVADTLPGPAQKTFVLYNPVDLERFHPAPERRVSPPLILGAGRLTSVKNFQLLLRAVAILRTRTAIRVAVVGEGPERAALEALARELKLEDVFAAPGYVVDPAPWFQEASVLVSCSRMEGFGNTLIEAMACGTPVVAIDAPGPFREVLGPFAEAGLVAETPQDLAAGIEAALQSPPRPEALRARANAFGLDPCADAYAAALDAVAGEKGRRA